MKSVDVDSDGRDPELEDTLDETFSRLLDEGNERLSRTWAQLLSTGTLAGFEIVFGLLVYLAVLEASGSPLLAGLGFSVGFVALLLGRSELFTESFFVPVITVTAGHKSLRDLLRLWLATLSMNLLGGWALMVVVVVALPALSPTLLESAAGFVEAGITLEAFCLSVLAGATITLMTRMQHGTEELFGKVVAAVVGALVLVGLELHHSVLDSLLAFGAFHVGAPFGYLDWLGWFSWTLLGNVLGGLLLVTVPRLLRSLPRLREERGRELLETPSEQVRRRYRGGRAAKGDSSG